MVTSDLKASVVRELYNTAYSYTKWPSGGGFESWSAKAKEIESRTDMSAEDVFDFLWKATGGCRWHLSPETTERLLEEAGVDTKRVKEWPGWRFYNWRHITTLSSQAAQLKHWLGGWDGLRSQEAMEGLVAKTIEHCIFMAEAMESKGYPDSAKHYQQQITDVLSVT